MTSNLISNYVQQVLSREIENYSLEKRYYRKDGSIVWITLTVSLLFDDKGAPDYFIAAVQDISERKQLEETKSLLLHDYGKRLKEIQCLHTISNSARTKSSLDEVFQDAVSAIPPGLHYPEFTRGKLRYGEETWVSEPFEESEWNPSADTIVNGKIRGRVEVYYLEESPTLDEGPFMKEERNLLDGIARTLSESIEHTKSNQDLIQSEMKYRTLLENIPDVIWTTDSEGNTTFMSSNIESIYGYTRNEICARGQIAMVQEDSSR